MEFTLYYDGPLPARGKPAAEAAIRAGLQPQMDELWNHHPLVDHREFLDPDRRDIGVSALVERFDHTFAALVSDALGLRVELDILLLRPANPGDLVIEGDIDNRLKTLFDALSVPAHRNQMP